MAGRTVPPAQPAAGTDQSEAEREALATIDTANEARASVEPATIQARIDALDRERAALIVQAFDHIAHEESHLAPYRAKLAALEQFKATVEHQIGAYNGIINELRKLLPGAQEE